MGGRLTVEALINKEIHNVYCKPDITVSLWLDCKLEDPA